MFHLLQKIFFSHLLLITAICSDAQNLELMVSKSISGIDNSTLDSQGNILISKLDGEIIKMNKNGHVLLTFSPLKTGKVKALDVRSPFKIVAYYDSFQEIVVLNRFLSEIVRYDLKVFQLGYISNATLNFQQNVWVVDESDFSLKLLDANNGQLIVHQPFFQFLDEDNHEISFIKEYQNRLYIVDKNYGILIFDNLGNLIDRQAVKGISSLGFEKDQCYYLKGDKIKFKDLYGQSKKEVRLPKPNYINVFKFGDYFFCTSLKQLDIYRYLRKD